MARPREFDTEEVLEKIIEVFWKQGFDRATFADLEQATGLRKGSLFAAYGDKETLFCLALEKYQRDKCQALLSLCSDKRSPRKVLESWIGHAAGYYPEERGCFIVNTITGFAPHSKKCSEIISTYWEKTEATICKLVEEGIRHREFSRSIKPSDAARYLVWIISGATTLSKFKNKACDSKKEVQSQISLALKALA